MRKLALLALVVAVVGLFAAEATAQRLPLFGTYVSAKTIQPGKVLGIAGYITDASKVNLASRDCYFIMGLSYNPKRYKTHFVLPPFALAKVPFRAVVKKGQPTRLYAAYRLQLPKWRLPRAFKLPLLFQAVAVAKGRNNSKVAVPAMPTYSVLVP